MEPTSLKLYIPLHFNLFLCDEWANWEDYPDYIDCYEAADYAKVILTSMDQYRKPKEAERGLMHYYNKDNSVNKKVHRAEFSVEVREYALWGTVKCLVKA